MARRWNERSQETETSVRMRGETRRNRDTELGLDKEQLKEEGRGRKRGEM